jgi:RNA polymerase sigma-70 factor (ECF subfamily)
LSDVHDNLTPAAARVGQRGTSKDLAWPQYLQRIARGDAQALSTLYDESNGLIYGLALRMLGNCADAEEIAMDVYSYVWRSAANWESSRGSALAWLTMLCRSRCIDRIRSRTSRAQVETALPASESDQLKAFDSVASDTSVYNRTDIYRALDQLEPEQRRLLELAFYSGLTHTELSDQLQIPLGTVKTRIRSAITRMRDLLQEFPS